MYKRNEVIEEEDLKWDIESKDEIEEKNLEVILEPDVKDEKISIEKKQAVKEPKNEKKTTITPIDTIIETTSYMGEKITLFLLLIIFPYILGTFLFFIVTPLWAGIDFNILFVAIDFWDWITHFLFWSIGYITLTFSGFSLLIYKSRK